VPSSGSTALSSTGMAVFDLTLEAYERMGWYGSAITPEQMASARRSFNFVFARWSNLGVNLWRQSNTPVRITFRQGTDTYDIDPAVISILPEAYVRQYTMLEATNIDPAVFATTNGSSIVTVNQTAHGTSAGQFVGFPVQASIGGVVVSGYYAVATAPTANQFTIDVGTNATGTASGAAVPFFETFSGSETVNVTLANHGLLTGSTFAVIVSTTVGGLTLNGNYTVTNALTANTFTITPGATATTNATAYENSGLAQLQLQNPQVYPTDRVLYPISRADYSSISNKEQQGVPTAFWFNRQISPSISIWPVPDQNGPYEFQFYSLTQIEDVTGFGSETADIPYRALEACASAVAAHLAMKWKPDRYDKLQAWADRTWMEFSDADRERVSFFVSPNFAGY
jgi:hypothetical protein